MMIIGYLLLLPGMMFAAGSADNMTLIFQNQTADDISVSIEEACLPVLNPDKTYRLPAKGRLAVRYDSTIASCVVLVPVEKELGVQTSIFTIEANKSDGSSSSQPQQCALKVFSADTMRRTYRMTSSCVKVAS